MKKFSREYFLGFDDLGIDPFRDEKFWMMSDITDYITYAVEGEYNGRPDLLSLDFYSTDELWWVIMQFNGLTSFRDVAPGAILRIPHPEALSRAFNSISDERPSTSLSTTVEI